MLVKNEIMLYDSLSQYKYGKCYASAKCTQEISFISFSLLGVSKFQGGTNKVSAYFNKKNSCSNKTWTKKKERKLKKIISNKEVRNPAILTQYVGPNPNHWT